MDTKVITAHVPLPLAEKVDELAARLERPRGWIVKQALAKANLKLTADSLAEDRRAIRDALATIKYEGLASGPIEFCAAPTPQCRDGNRTAVLVQYTKGGENFQTKVLARVSFDKDFGLTK